MWSSQLIIQVRFSESVAFLFFSFRLFFLAAYLMPNDREVLFRVIMSHPRNLFIANSLNRNCGSGIKLVSFSNFCSIPPGPIVSTYISKSLCIDEFKWNLRRYVLVTPKHSVKLNSPGFRQGKTRIQARFREAKCWNTQTIESTGGSISLGASPMQRTEASPVTAVGSTQTLP
jgi:hypothetical protein